VILKFREFINESYLSESEYVVQKGDNISGIAQKLGIGDWRKLYDLNKDAIGENPSDIKVGMKLKTPGESKEIEGKKKEKKKEKKIEPLKDLFLNPLDLVAPLTPKVLLKNIKPLNVKSEYKNWEDIKKRVRSVNAMVPSEIIKEYHKDTKDKYLILDKKKGQMKLYQGNKEISTFRVGIGQNFGDHQTKTVVKDGKVYWEEGNRMTGAGIYTVSAVNPKNENYSDAPSFNFRNEAGIEVPMAIHSSFGNRTGKLKDEDLKNNRLSNGCINGIANELKVLYSQGFGEGSYLYILPDESENKFQIVNGKLVFRSKDPEVNRSTKTLNYKPIKVVIDETAFKNAVFQALDFNDEKEYNNTTKPFVKALEYNKRKVMLAARINGDVYNDLAKIAFGIYGTESNFGDTHSAVGNLFRAGKKYLSPSSSSSPDYMSKATTYGANKNTNSVGLTQIRFNMLDQSEKDILKKLGITSNQQLLKPDGAALATLGILAARYNNQLTDEERKDPMANLPKKWNVRKNYPDRVKSNSRFITVKELV
jgi:hypothetical protein